MKIPFVALSLSLYVSCKAQKRMSTSMHEVFHWGSNTTAAPKNLSLSIAGSQIDFEGPPSPRRQTAASRYSARNRNSMVMVESNNKGEMRILAMALNCVLFLFWQCFWCGFFYPPLPPMNIFLPLFPHFFVQKSLILIS